MQSIQLLAEMFGDFLNTFKELSRLLIDTNLKKLKDSGISAFFSSLGFEMAVSDSDSEVCEALPPSSLDSTVATVEATNQDIIRSPSSVEKLLGIPNLVQEIQRKKGRPSKQSKGVNKNK